MLSVTCTRQLKCKYAHNVLYVQVMQLAGLEGQQVVLLLEDYQFVHSAFLEMVNSLLSSGVYCAVCLCVFIASL